MDDLPQARAFYRHRYTPAVERRDLRPHRRFIAGLLGFAALIEFANANTWTKFLAGVALTLIAVVCGVLGASRRRDG